MNPWPSSPYVELPQIVVQEEFVCNITAILLHRPKPVPARKCLCAHNELHKHMACQGWSGRTQVEPWPQALNTHADCVPGLTSVPWPYRRSSQMVIKFRSSFILCNHLMFLYSILHNFPTTDAGAIMLVIKILLKAFSSKCSHPYWKPWINVFLAFKNRKA